MAPIAAFTLSGLNGTRDDRRLVGVPEVFTGGIKSFAHDPSHFIVEVGSQTDERNNRRHDATSPRHDTLIECGNPRNEGAPPAGRRVLGE